MGGAGGTTTLASDGCGADAEATAAAARFLGNALRQRMKVRATSDDEDDAIVDSGKAAARSIADASSGEAEKSSGRGGTTVAGWALSGAASAALSLGSLSLRVASGAAGAASRAVASAVWDDGYDPSMYLAEELGEEGGGSIDNGADDYLSTDAETDETCGSSDDLLLVGAQIAARGVATSSPPLPALGPSDKALSVPAVLGCCASLLQYSESAVVSYDSEDGDSTRLLLKRFGGGAHSFQELCHAAGCEAAAKAGGTDRRDDKADYGPALSQLRPADIDLLALTLLSSGHAAISKDGDIIALYPVTSTRGATDLTVDEADVAMFRLRNSIEAVEGRTESLAQQARDAGDRAVRAKRDGAKSLAAVQMRRRKLFLDEADRCSGTLLNLEAAAQGLRRARDDAKVLECYEMARNALRMVRAKEENGGMGMTLERVEEAADGLGEEVDELRTLGDAIDIGGSCSREQIDDEELEREFKSLELEINADGLKDAVINNERSVAFDATDDSSTEINADGLKDVVSNNERSVAFDATDDSSTAHSQKCNDPLDQTLDAKSMNEENINPFEERKIQNTAKNPVII